jgi:uncharacterized membrane protein
LGETRARSFTKAITYRVWQSLNTFIISFLITGKLGMALAIVSLEFVVKLVVYFLHERAWDRVLWGRQASQMHSYDALS